MKFMKQELDVTHFNELGLIDCKNSDEVIEKFDCIKYLPNLVFIKSLGSSFLATSKSFSNFVGWDKSEQSIGRYDYDMPCPLSEISDIFVDQDKQALFISDSKVSTITIGDFACGNRAILGKKIPLKNKLGKSLGIYCQSVDVTNTTCLISFRQLINYDQRIIGQQKAVSYNIGIVPSPLRLLTKQQQSIVFLMIRGKITKEIAYLLNIPTKKIEYHIMSIKYKLGCSTKGQIIEKAIHSGFVSYIPEEFLRNQ